MNTTKYMFGITTEKIILWSLNMKQKWYVLPVIIIFLSNLFFASVIFAIENNGQEEYYSNDLKIDISEDIEEKENDERESTNISFNGYFSDIEFDDFSVELDDDEVFIYPKHSKKKYLKITEGYDLFVNDDKIEIDEEQKEFLIMFHKLVSKVYDEAIDLGLEGAKIGVKGASLGLKVFPGLLKMMFTSYDSDDFERDMEAEAEKLEKVAEELEEVAEELEYKTIKIEKYYFSLKDIIPELEKYKWF